VLGSSAHRSPLRSAKQPAAGERRAASSRTDSTRSGRWPTAAFDTLTGKRSLLQADTTAQRLQNASTRRGQLFRERATSTKHLPNSN
jgi:hypothetical protein